jgi:hypothetical protein
MLCPADTKDHLRGRTCSFGAKGLFALCVPLETTVKGARAPFLSERPRLAVRQRTNAPV